MARSTYHDQVQALISKGYLVHSHGNTYEFYEIPRPRGGISTSEDPAGVGQISENNPADDKEMPEAGSSVLPQDTEIDNKGNPTDRGINNEIYVPKVVEVCIPVPVAQGPKRPQLKQTQKKEKFVYSKENRWKETFRIPKHKGLAPSFERAESMPSFWMGRSSTLGRVSISSLEWHSTMQA